MTEPKVGEYWYYRPSNIDNRVRLGKILVKYNDWNDKPVCVFDSKAARECILESFICGKWEPNWFWKMLGYK